MRQPAAAPPPAPAPRADSLKDRLLDIRTLVSFVVLALLLGFLATRVQLDYRQTVRAITAVSPGLYGLAFVAFYCSFLVRTLRWQVLLRNTREWSPYRNLFQIVILAFFANCILPAKMGDFYRAYLLRERTRIPGSKGLGTIVSERVLDFLVLMILLLLSGLLSFRSAIPSQFLRAFVAGLAISLTLVLGLLLLRFGNGRMARWVPKRFKEHLGRFTGGLLDAFTDRLPWIVGLSVLVWMAESARLYLVVLALPLPVSLHLAQVVFIALVASLLTTIPALPGGLVLVEGGIIAVLAVFGLTPSQGLSVAILDRVISYWSLIAVGLVVFLVSRR